MPGAWAIAGSSLGDGSFLGVSDEVWFIAAMPMVREGAFKYSSNAMYIFVFIGLWGVALLFRSRAALAVAMFQHAYIWVHWYCTEQPDGVVLYGRSPEEDQLERHPR